MKNAPYVKQFDSKGLLINPIEKEFISSYPNRRQRKPNRERFTGCGKNYPVVVTRTSNISFHKCLKSIQTIVCKDGSIKRIEHYRTLN